MTYILITHNDMDGAGCEIVYRLYHQGQNVRVFSCTYSDVNSILQRILDSRDTDQYSTIITVADISPDSPELLREMINRGYTVNFYDHHQTSEWATSLIPNATVSVDGPDSGTSLLYGTLESQKHLKNKRLREFVDTVRSWDVWEWVKTGNVKAKHLSVLFYMLGYDRFVQLYTNRFLSGDNSQPLILPEHMMFVNARMESSQRVIDNTTPDTVMTRKIFGYNAAVLFAGSGFSFSDGAYQFLRKYPQYDIMVNVDLARKTLSYRTIRNDIDLGKLATTVGGGGHDKSAGSPIAVDKVSSVLNLIINDCRV